MRLAWWQLREPKQQAVTQFEDGLSREYRELTQRLPTEALLGEELPEERYRETLDEFFHYVDLSNEQVFLRLTGSVSLQTWNNWRDGIRNNLSRPAFRRAWEEIKRRAPESFQEVRQLENSGFTEDPRRFKT